MATLNAVISRAVLQIENCDVLAASRLMTLLNYWMLAMKQQTNNAGCRSCRYYLQTVSECLKENRRGELMRAGLAGQCFEFKEILTYPTKNETSENEI